MNVSKLKGRCKRSTEALPDNNTSHHVYHWKGLNKDLMDKGQVLLSVDRLHYPL